MFVLILPGYSTKNKPEAYNISEVLEAAGHQTLVYEWPHWEDVRLQLRPDFELPTIRSRIEEVARQPELAIVAKSIGTFVAMLLLQKYSDIDPQKIILLGFPLTSLDEQERKIYPEMIARFKDRTHILQNEHDPHGGSEEVKALLGEHQALLQVMPGRDDHRYDYPQEVEQLLRMQN